MARENLQNRTSSPQATLRLSLGEQDAVLELRRIFQRQAARLQSTIAWAAIEAGLVADREAIVILTKLLARGGEPTVLEANDRGIKWTESAKNVPLQPVDGIPMNYLAYDEVGQKAAEEAARSQPWRAGCHGNALNVARGIHNRVRLASREESTKLAEANLTRDDIAYPWLYTPDSARGNIRDSSGGKAWYGECGEVKCSSASDSGFIRGARFSLWVPHRK